MYCLFGIRWKDGVNLIWAFAWNVGTCSVMLREKFKWRSHKNESTDAQSRGEVTRISDEAAVMAVERRGYIVQLQVLSNQKWKDLIYATQLILI